MEEWKDGLPGKALQKIQEIEVQLDKLKKERTQKQFQLDSLEAALQKQKQKVIVQERDYVAHTEFNTRVSSAKTVVLNHSFGNAIRRYTKLLKGVFIVYMSLASGGQ